MPKPLRWLALPLLGLLAMPISANAATLVVFGTTSADASATGSLTLNGNVVNLSLTNTSAFDGRITGVGFDLAGGSGNSGLNGFTGSSTNANFTFTDGDLGNVPMFNSTVLDFGFRTGKNFAGGSPNDGIDQLQTVNFSVMGNFGGFTDSQIASALFVRFQRVGPNGEGSDVGVGQLVNTTAVPEPASMLLFGTGLAALARRKLRQRKSA